MTALLAVQAACCQSNDALRGVGFPSTSYCLAGAGTCRALLPRRLPVSGNGGDLPACHRRLGRGFPKGSCRQSRSRLGGCGVHPDSRRGGPVPWPLLWEQQSALCCLQGPEPLGAGVLEGRVGEQPPSLLPLSIRPAWCPLRVLAWWEPSPRGTAGKRAETGKRGAATAPAVPGGSIWRPQSGQGCG